MRLLRTFITCLSAILALPPIAAAQDPARTHDITADDYFTIAVVAEPAMSPDGKLVAYTDTRWEPPAEKRNTELWVAEARGGEPRRLTFDPANDHAARWSADGRWIYFLSNRQRGDEKTPPYDGKTQVWRIAPDGGDAQPVTRVADGVQLFDLSDDGKTLYYTVAAEHVAAEWAKLKKEYKKLEYGHGVHELSALWKLDLVSWRAEKLIDEKRSITSFDVTADGSRIAMITAPTEHLISNEGWSRMDVWDAATKKITTLPDEMWRRDAPSPYGWLESPCWSHNGQNLAFRVDFDGYPSEIFIATFVRGDVQLQKLKRPDGVHYAFAPVSWRGTADDLCYLAEERARSRVYCTANILNGKQGPSRVLTDGDVVCEAFTFSRTGREMALSMSGLTHPPELFVVPFGPTPAKYERISRINPQVDTWKLPQIQLVTWKGAEGDEVEGILELPPDYVPDKRLPMIVEIHGGPTAATMYHMRFWIYGRTLMAARGFALFSPNYRGSTGYGDNFMTDLIGHANDRDVQDILTGVDAMIDKGVADPNVLGVMGWSNGGFLTNCLITRTTRFKAASSGAGISDVAMQWSIEDTPGHIVNFQRGFPWTRAEEMRKTSALYAADKIRTPTLFHVGANDERCPPQHQRALYRALHQYLDVPCELIVYPGEGHSLSTYEHRKAKMQWDLAWFDRYLLGKSGDDGQ